MAGGGFCPSFSHTDHHATSTNTSMLKAHGSKLQIFTHTAVGSLHKAEKFVPAANFASEPHKQAGVRPTLPPLKARDRPANLLSSPECACRGSPTSRLLDMNARQAQKQQARELSCEVARKWVLLAIVARKAMPNTCCSHAGAFVHCRRKKDSRAKRSCLNRGETKKMHPYQLDWLCHQLMRSRVMVS